MSEDTVKKALENTLLDLQELMSRDIEKDRKAQFRLRTRLIKALYWLDRYMSEQYFRAKAEESQKKEDSKGKKRKRRGE